jgi:Peptidase family M23
MRGERAARWLPPGAVHGARVRGDRAARRRPPGAVHGARVRADGAVAGGWSWPLRGRVVGFFRLTPGRPFARGQRRGIDMAAAAAAPVLAPCAGRVRFAGALPDRGLAVTVRCGDLVATELGLGRLAVRVGTRVGQGARVGELGASGVLRLGARRAGDRFGYVDPLELLGDPRPSRRPVVGPAPRGGLPRPAPPLASARPIPRIRPAAPSNPPLARPAPATPRGLPWPAYPALALVAVALPVGGLVRRRRRRAAPQPAVARHGA